MRKIALALMLLTSTLAARAQAVDNTLYAKAFPGTTTGFKVTTALQSCNASATLQCFIVLDPSLNNWPNGTMPTIPANVHLIDYRYGLPWGSGAGYVSASTPGTIFCIPYWTSQIQLGNSPVCYDSATGTTTLNVNAAGNIVLSSAAVQSHGDVIMDATGNGGSSKLTFDGVQTSTGMSLTVTNGGNGYTPNQIGGCTVVGGSFTQQATCAVEGGTNGQLQVVMINPGIYTAPATSVSITGITTGSGMTYALAMGQPVADQWFQYRVTPGSGTASQLFIDAPSRQTTAAGNVFQLGTTPLQGMGSGYLWKIPQPNLTGTTFLTQDMDQVTSSQSVHWPNQSGTIVVALSTNPDAGPTLNQGTLNIPPSTGTCGSGHIPCTNTANFFKGGTQQITTAAYNAVGAIDQGSAVYATPAYLAGSTGGSPSGGGGGSGTSNTLALGASIPAGSGLIVYFDCFYTSTFASVTDNLGNTYTQIASSTGSSLGTTFVFGAANSAAGTPTLSWTTNQYACEATYVAYSAVSGFNTAAAVQVSTTSNTTNTAGPLTTTNSDMLIAQIMTAPGVSASSFVPSTGYTVRMAAGTVGSGYDFAIADYNPAVPGTYSNTWNWTTGQISIGTLIGLIPGVADQQIACLRQFKNYNGVVLSCIDGNGSLSTQTAANTDQAGVLALAAATTASYTWANPNYASHPVCFGSADADPGARWFITYTGTTAFTVNFTTAYTGNFDYGCIPRN